MQLNRVVAALAVITSLGLALTPVIANMDLTSTAGIIAGIIAVLGVTQTWLLGWQKHEAREAAYALPLPPEPDQGDAGAP